ncbi:MAG: aminoacyl-histidine dipeptidase [Odoribacteraceae bacterium]|jgi:dipeptidase D|nr:aminoacyl-histidine dipeptidase [Odoribacteraceae bacterium]
MSKSIIELSPREVWENFHALTRVPRPSHHEEKARAFIMQWAKEHGIQAEIDEACNILLSKPATPGMENREGVILQGHLDMVPQKNRDKVHDFTKDPIDARVEGEWVTADGTTLGADNGIGVAAAMAVLLSKDIPHGPLEVLITATEETGMDGANGIRQGWLKGNILLNLDSETEGELYVGCAGGVNGKAIFYYRPEPVPDFNKAFKLSVVGLRGGHSGMDIHLGRGNANKLFFRLLKSLNWECGMNVHVASMEGGNMRNAIPREAVAVVTVYDDDVPKLVEAVKTIEATFRTELQATEPDLACLLEPTTRPDYVIDYRKQRHITNAILACPNGAVRMIDSMPDTVETSNNLAIVKMEKDCAEVNMLLRSSVESAKKALAQSVQAAFELADADEIGFTGGYPGWEPNPASRIRETMIATRERLYGEKPAIMAIHAGLECGILGAAYPRWDMISFGPTILSPHSPDEKVNIASVGKFWEYMQATLAAIPSK